MILHLLIKFCIFVVAGCPRGQSACHIGSFLLQPFLRYEGGPQNSKSRSRDPSRPVSKGSPVTPYLNSPDPIFEFLDTNLPIYYITFAELRWQLRVVYR